MKTNTTTHFQNAIKDYLDKRAEKDPLFAQKYRNTDRTIEDVCAYIINQVKSSGICGWHDDEIYSMAMHVIDEPSVEIGKPIACQVVINHHIQLTEEEKAEARKQAIAQFQASEIAKLTNKPKKKAELQAEEAPSLFDF
ncbi:MAG: PcfK-like family protein [Bacteroidales bacterium]|nr:PcfK-like family protein [Bacteroidales bacterium]